MVEATFDPLPLTSAVAREWGRLMSVVAERGGQPRRRSADLAIAATAIIEGVPLLTWNAKDLTVLRDLVDVRTPNR